MPVGKSDVYQALVFLETAYIPDSNVGGLGEVWGKHFRGFPLRATVATNST